MVGYNVILHPSKEYFTYVEKSLNACEGLEIIGLCMAFMAIEQTGFKGITLDPFTGTC